MPGRAIPRCFSVLIATLFFVSLARSATNDLHDAAFWKAIKENNFAVPAHESAGALALEIPVLAASTDPTLRDGCGYEILAAWVYRNHLLTPEQLESLRSKLLPAMTAHIGESENDTVFGRSFSALYMSILAAQDLRQPFLSDATFKQTLDVALRCYAEEKDLRGYVPIKGWAHATAHVADLLKFLARSPHLSVEDQRRIVNAVAQRGRSAHLVFIWGEDARMAATLLSIVDRKDFDASIFKTWFDSLIGEHNELWKSPTIEQQAYASVRVQTNVLAHLSAKCAAEKDQTASANFREALSAALTKLD